MLFDDKHPEFRTANKRSIEFANKVETYLKGWGIPSLIVIINSMSLFLKTQEQYKQLNSTLCIAVRGSGKSTLLLHILAKSNPKMFQILPKKIFESELVKKPRDYFDNKILIHDDIIVAFGGLNKKQREQLIGFFGLLLSDQSYSREGLDHLKNVRCLAHLGIASESYSKYKKQLLEATFLDRFCSFEVKTSRSNKKDILNHRDYLKEKDVQLPVIKLPFFAKKVPIKLHFDEEIRQKRNKLALELDDYGVISFARAQNFIDIFLMSNALLNNRKVVNAHDLALYEELHSYHLESSGELSMQAFVKALILDYGETIDGNILKEHNLSKSSFYRHRRRLRNLGEI